MKGQQEVIAVILISGILIGVVGSVYLWGVPLIQKNKDIATLENSEKFVRSLNNKIKFIANNGGRDQTRIDLPGIFRFTSNSNSIELVVDTQGTIYATDAEIPLGKNAVCAAVTGVFGLDDPDTICVKSTKISEDSYKTTYTIKYLKLINVDVGRNFLINLIGDTATGGEASTIIFENKGTAQTNDNDKVLITSVIYVTII